MSRKAVSGLASLLLPLCLTTAAKPQDLCTYRPGSAMGSPFGGDSREIGLSAQDVNDRGIRQAQVTFDSHWTANADGLGMASIDSQSGMHLPLSVELQAAGDQDRELLVDSSNDTRQTGGMLRSGPPDPGTSHTVGVKELKPGVQEKSQELQSKAYGAMRRGDYAQAEKLLRQAVELTPSSVSAYTGLGAVCLRRKGPEQAATWFEKAARAAPFDPIALENLGLVRWMLGRQEEGCDLLSRAEAKGYSTESGNYILGISALMKGLAEKAEAHLKRVNPAKYLYRDLFLALAKRSRGNLEASNRSYRDFLRRKPVPFAYSVLPVDLVRRS